MIILITPISTLTTNGAQRGTQRSVGLMTMNLWKILYSTFQLHFDESDGDTSINQSNAHVMPCHTLVFLNFIRVSPDRVSLPVSWYDSPCFWGESFRTCVLSDNLYLQLTWWIFNFFHLRDERTDEIKLWFDAEAGGSNCAYSAFTTIPLFCSLVSNEEESIFAFPFLVVELCLLCGWSWWTQVVLLTKPISTVTTDIR